MEPGRGWSRDSGTRKVWVPFLTGSLSSYGPGQGYTSLGLVPSLISGWAQGLAGGGVYKGTCCSIPPLGLSRTLHLATTEGLFCTICVKLFLSKEQLLKSHASIYIPSQALLVWDDVMADGCEVWWEHGG